MMKLLSEPEIHLAAKDSGAALEELTQFLYLAPVGLVRFGVDGAVGLMNPMAAQLLLPARAGRTDLSNIFAALGCLVPDLEQAVTHFGRDVGTIIRQRRCETKSGPHTLMLSVTIDRVSPSSFMAVIEDVTRITTQERRIFADGERFRAIFDNVRDYAIYTIDIAGRIEDWNQSLYRFAGWLPEDVEGRHMSLFFPQDDPDRIDVDRLLAEARRIGSVEIEGWRVKRDGSRLWGNTVITALPDADGEVHGFAVVARDMTERKLMEDELKRLSNTDPLTGVYNRRYAEAFLAQTSDKFALEDRSFAVMLLDIDRFKAINDRFGHECGDIALSSLVRMCRQTLRSTDVLARWGGEEFLVVCPGIVLPDAVALAERLRVAVAGMVVATPGGEVRFTVSIGITTPAETGPTELLRRADRALYLAKSGGRDRVVAAAG